MPFKVSPGVSITEIDQTSGAPAISTTEGAIAGLFRWGPVGERTLIESEVELVATFGKPTSHNPETWFTAGNFLAYSNKLYVVRAANTVDSSNGVLTAIANTGSVADPLPFVVKTRDDYDAKREANTFVTSDSDVKFAARWPGALGNSLKISVCDSAAAFEETLDLVTNATTIDSGNTSVAVNVGSNTATFVFAYDAVSGAIGDANTAANTILNKLSLGDLLEVGNSDIGKQYMKITGLPSYGSNDSGYYQNSTHAYFTVNLESKMILRSNFEASTITRYWEYFSVVERAPGRSQYMINLGAAGNTAANDELHVAVIDEDGQFSGVPGTVLEVFQNMSRVTTAKTEDGADNYYGNVIKDSSYIWWTNDRAGAISANASHVASSGNQKPLTISLSGGQDGDDEGVVEYAVVAAGYDQFKSAEDVDISLLLAGKARGGTNGELLANYIIDNVAEKRKDCVAYISPERGDVVNKGGNEASNVINFRNSLTSSSYAFLDSGYKYQYDRYNDTYRYLPLNGDMAGLAARTDDVRDPWFSPAGYNRGAVKNIVRLAYNPSESDRDSLYKKDINPVVTFPGQGTVLFGDKTLLGRTSPFDRINVRRLFIVVEKSIATAAKQQLFEFNDDFTRAQFKNLIEPFLRDVQGRRGIYDFRVVCDETNNTSEIIDSNQFIGDIYIKPTKSINFIQLNFVAVRSGVEFSEVVGTTV